MMQAAACTFLTLLFDQYAQKSLAAHEMLSFAAARVPCYLLKLMG